MTTAIKNIIDNIFSSQEDWRIKLLIKWDTIVGGLKTRVRLEKIYEDTLVIGVYESHWMQELYLLSSIIIQNINDNLDKPRITNLRFKIVEIKKNYNKINTSGKNYKDITLNFSLNTQQTDAIKKVKDNQLAEVLILFLERCIKNNTMINMKH